MLAFGRSFLFGSLFLFILSACGGGGGDGSDDIIRDTITLDPVAELFSNAAKWNDYAPGSEWSTASNTACTAASDIACIHGGEHRMVLVTGKTECTGLTASDDLSAFNWVCDNSIGTARMISTGLADGKHLSDLIDFSTAGFKPNAVTVSDSIGVWGSTPSSVWWTNPVVVNNSAGALDVTDSTIYLVTSDPGAFWLFQTDKLALVVQPGITLSASGGSSGVVIANPSDYLWLEGSIDATGLVNGVILSGVRFSVLNNLTVNNAGPLYGVSLQNASRNRLTSVVASNGDDTGINLDSASSNNTLANVTASNNGRYGIRLDNASNNRLSGVTASDNTSDGIRLDNAAFNTLSGLTVNNNVSGVNILNNSSNNTLSVVKASNNRFGILLVDAPANTLTEVTASNNSTSGINLIRSSNNRLLVVTASNNGTGVDLFASSNNTLAGLTVNSNFTGALIRAASNSNTVTGVTASNNSGSGGELDTSINNTLLGVAASNNNLGVVLAQASNNTLSDVAASNNNEGIDLFSGSNNNTFTGLLEVGNNSLIDCFVGFATAPGLDNNTCVANGTSDSTLVGGIDLTNAFVGKVLIEDVLNTDDTNGTAASFPATPTEVAAFDWTSFDNEFRGWGVNGSTFPSTNQRGPWTLGGGRIWDWSVSIGDNGNAGTPALLNVLTLPTAPVASDTLTHIWEGPPASNDDTGCNAMVAGSVWNGTDSVCETRFLRNTVELSADGVGNDNTLCESSETCIYLPNIGSYQGHGNFVSAGTFTDGILTGITLIKYETNGR